MKTLFEDIKDFHEKFGLQYDSGPRMLPPDLDTFRTEFLQEELWEYRFAKTKEDKFDALIDLVYVAIGTAYMHGFDFDKGWKRVQEANMKKVRVARPEDSKRGSGFDVVKPEGWTAPDLTDLVL